MNWILLVSYVGLIVFVFYSITSIPIALIGGLLGRLTIPLLGLLIASIVAWYCYNLIWISLNGDNLPLLASALCFLAIGLSNAVSAGRLNENAKNIGAAEQWGIVIIAIYNAVTAENLNWI